MIVHHDGSDAEPEPAWNSRDARTAEEPLKKRHKFTIILAGLIVLAGILIVLYFIFLANTPTKGTVKLVTPPPNTQQPAPDLSLKGKYIHFNYGSSYISENTQITIPHALEQHVLLSNGFEGKQIAVTVQPLVEGSLEEFAAYKFRSVHPEDYSEKPLNVTGSTGAVMVKHDGSEVTAFIIKGDTITSISMTCSNSAAQNAGLEAEMAKLLKTFSWVQ